MKLQEIYHSSGINRSPKCLSWHKNRIIYGSCNAIVLAKLIDDTEGPRVISVFSSGHSDRVNSVQWLEDGKGFVTASTDGSAILWKEVNEDNFEIFKYLKGSSKSLTSISAVTLQDSNILIATSSGDSTVRVYLASLNSEGKDLQALFELDLKGGYALDVKVERLALSNDRSIPCLFYSKENGKVYMHSWLNAKLAFTLEPSYVFVGHEDWVRGIDVLVKKDCSYVATCGQDTFIRIWKIVVHRKTSVPDKDCQLIKVKEDLIVLGDENIAFCVSLETILCGHEDIVYGVQWNTFSVLPTLLSCSLDKTMMVWAAPEGVNEGGVWTETVRVGEVGGNTLGFLGCQFGHEGKQILGYSFNGAFHLWVSSDTEEVWSSGVIFGGHFDAVEDIDWEKNGRYLMSVSTDQTTRIHAPWCSDSFSRPSWQEVARPQVHGYDLSCITALPGQRFVSGAEEKVIRVFQGTKNFLKNLASITKTSLKNEETFAQGASVPALGLSNRAVYDDQQNIEDEEEDKHVKDQFPDLYFKDISYFDPPSEETLVQNTLWPEIRKLYGHVYEVFRLASNESGTIVASSSKASKKEHASIILWSTKNWSILGRLTHHNLTVTTMAFSPSEKYFLSGSRDRSWALYKKSKDNDLFHPISAPSTKSKGYPHQRLIWSAGFSNDSNYFYTSSRDKKVAIWKLSPDEEGTELCAVITLEDSVTAGGFAPFSVDGKYVLAVGLENGKILLLTFIGNELNTEFALHPHHRTVKKLKFHGDLLGSCSTDRSVKIFRLNK